MNNLPSKWQIGDFVSLHFPGNGILKKCKVVKVSFTYQDEPLYDLEVPYDFYLGEYDGGNQEPNTGHARLHGLKEWHLRNPENSVADRYPLPQ